MSGRMLFVAYGVPPLMSSHSLRLLYFIRYLTEAGWQLDVLTIKPSANAPIYDAGSVERLPPSARVFRTHPGLHKLYYDRLGHRDSQPGNSVHGGLRRMASKALRELLIPDASITWYPTAMCQAVRLIKSNKYDLLLSSGGLATAHLIAYSIMKMVKLPWVMDLGDPWVFEPSYRHSRLRFRIEYGLESRLLKAASAIVVTTEETRQSYLESYPFLAAEKVKVILSGADCEQFRGVPPERGSRFRTLYAGSIHATQDIRPFLEAMRLAKEKVGEDVEALFIGKTDSECKQLVADMRLETVVAFKPFVPQEQIPPLLAGADILLFFGHRGGLQIPGKLYYCLAAGRPILCIKGGKKDASVRLLEGLNRAVIVDNEIEQICSAIVRLYGLYRGHKLDGEFNLEEVPGLSWRSRAEILNQLCEELVGAGRRSN